MRPRLRLAVFCTVCLISATSFAQAPPEAPESIPRAWLLELLKTAPAAPIPPGGAAASGSLERRKAIRHDLTTGIETVSMPQNVAGLGTGPRVMPQQRGQYPTGRHGSGIGPQGVAPLNEIFATPPSPLLDTLRFPNNTVYKLLMRFNSGGVNYVFNCSASAIDSFHLLTAAHCIYNHDPNGDGNTSDRQFAREVWAFAAQTDRLSPSGAAEHPYGEAKSILLTTYDDWINYTDYGADVALITLNRRVGSRTGWMGRETNTASSTLNFSGYPTQTPYVPAGNLLQYPGSGSVQSYTTRRIDLSAYIYGGHSGGPVWRTQGSETWIQGVNSTGDRMGNSQATRIDDGTFDDLNNWMAEDASIRPPVAKADLIEYLFSTTDKDLLTNIAAPGGQVTVKYNAYNSGHATANSVLVDFWLSRNSTVTTADTYLDTVFLNTIPQNNVVITTATFTLPADLPLGTYYIGWTLSTSSNEYTSDDNTVVIGEETLLVTLSPDLEATFLGTSSAVLTGAPLEVVAGVENSGRAASSSTTLGYYLSTDATIGPSDMLLGTAPVPVLNAGETWYAPPKTVTAPTSPGDYWLGICVSAVSGELVTDNQCSLTALPIRVIGRPNLRTVTPGVSQSALLTRGSFVATATIENLGETTAPATTLRYYASTDATITTTDTLIGTGAVASLAAGSAAAYANTVQAPSAPGSYWIGGCVDVAADENITSDQCSPGVAIVLTHFSDDSLQAGMTARAIHFLEMRIKVNQLRSARGMAAAVWTDPSLASGTSMIKAIHLQEIRAALAQVYAYDGVAAPSYTNPSISPGSPIRVIDIIEARAAIVARP